MGLPGLASARVPPQQRVPWGHLVILGSASGPGGQVLAPGRRAFFLSFTQLTSSCLAPVTVPWRIFGRLLAVAPGRQPVL